MVGGGSLLEGGGLVEVVVVDDDFLIESRKRVVPRSRRSFCSRMAVEARPMNWSKVERRFEVDDDVEEEEGPERVVGGGGGSGFIAPHCRQDPPAPWGQAARSENPAQAWTRRPHPDRNPLLHIPPDTSQ